MYAEMHEIVDDTSSCPSPEHIMSRFHHSVHQHFQSCASVRMDEIEFDDCSPLESLGNTLLAGKNGAASLSFVASMDESYASCPKALLQF